MRRELITYNRSPNAEDCCIQTRQKHLLLTFSIPSIIQEKPKDATQPISEPTCKQCTDQRQQVVEHGDSLGDDPCYNPYSCNDEDPDPDTHHIVVAHTFRSVEIIPEDANVDVFSSDVAIYDSSNDNGRDGDTVCDFL